MEGSVTITLEELDALRNRNAELEWENKKLVEANHHYFEEHSTLVSRINSSSWREKLKFVFKNHIYPNPWGQKF